MIDLALVKTHLKVDGDEEDTLVQGYVDAAISAFELWTNRKLIAEGGQLPDPVGNALVITKAISQGALLLGLVEIELLRRVEALGDELLRALHLLFGKRDFAFALGDDGQRGLLGLAALGGDGRGGGLGVLGAAHAGLRLAQRGFERGDVHLGEGLPGRHRVAFADGDGFEAAGELGGDVDLRRFEPAVALHEALRQTVGMIALPVDDGERDAEHQ